MAPRVNLGVVAPAPLWRPALRIEARPDLAAAFERGERFRRDPSALDPVEVMDLSPDERHAFWQGLGRTGPVRAPNPLGLSTIGTLIPPVVERQSGRWAGWAAVVAALAFQGVLIDRRRIERGRRLGLTPATAPRPAAMGPTLAPVLLEGVAQIVHRVRCGRTRPDVCARAAATLVRELRGSRDWRRALASRVSG